MIPCIVLVAQDQLDIAPTRVNNKKASPNLRKRDTLERQEIEAGDQFPEMLDNDKLVRFIIVFALSSSYSFDVEIHTYIHYRHLYCAAPSRS